MTYYEVLEIDSGASTEEIERAFRRVARKVHPDLNAGDAAKAEARMKLLNEIRETLTDSLLRAGYDERLRLEALRRDHRAPVPPRAEPPEAPRAAEAPAPPAAGVAGEPPRRSPALWVGLLLGALGTGVVTVALVSTPSISSHLPDPFANAAADAAGGVDAAPLLVAPTRNGAAREAGGPAPAAGHGHTRGRFVLHIGSSADDVLRALGPPDRYEPGPRPGESVLYFGHLRLEMKNGRVAGGDAAAR